MDVTLGIKDVVFWVTMIAGFAGNAALLTAKIKSLSKQSERMYSKLFGNGEPGMDEELRTLQSRFNDLPCVRTFQPRRKNDPPEMENRIAEQRACGSFE